MPTPYKIKLLNGLITLKTFGEKVIQLLGIKDSGTQTGDVTNGLVDWSLQHFTKTTAEWGADTTTILLRGQLGIEDTGNNTFKLKIGNGTGLWSALGYAGGGTSSIAWGSITGTLSDQADLVTELSSVLSSANTYTDSEISAAVAGLLDDRGNYDASVNTFPASGGSGTAGAILKGDLWTISVAGTLGGTPVTIGDVVRSLSDSPGQTASNWVVTENNIGYVPENNANKSNSSLDSASTTKFPVWAQVVSWVTSALASFKTANFLDATSSVQTQINNRVVDVGYFDMTSFNPLDATLYYSNPINNLTWSAGPSGRHGSCDATSTIQKHKIIFWNNGVLGNAVASTLRFHNSTQGTSEVLSTAVFLNAVNNAYYFSSALSFNPSDLYYYTLETGTFPTANPTVIFTQAIPKFLS
jgi:hypothetical protein